MAWTSLLAIYFLLVALSLFLVLPFGVRTHEDEGVERIEGQDHGAPVHFRPGKTILRAMILAAFLLALFYANYVNGWISVRDLDVFGGPPEHAQA